MLRLSASNLPLRIVRTTSRTTHRHCAPSSLAASSYGCPVHSTSLQIAWSSSRCIVAAVPSCQQHPRFLTTSTSAGNTASAVPHGSIVYTQKIPKKKSSFRDRVRLHVSGGRGGTGCSSYDTDPYGRGGPDGANGGRGGDVYLVSTDQLSVFSLETFHLKGQSGQAGGSKLAKGRNGFSLKVPVPAGTVVSEILGTDPSKGEYTLRLLADMDRSGLEIKVASGGAGGLGNRAFKTQYRKQARFSTVGQQGTAKWLHLELKCIADVGLVGYPKSVDKQATWHLLGKLRVSLPCSSSAVLSVPISSHSAGKSSFLAAISNATPEIANYPFTTLHPQVGVVELGAFQGNNANTTSVATPPPSPSSLIQPSSSSDAINSLTRITIADLPGLISGASRQNKGLGHEFLKHIQRTSVLCYVIDLSGNDQRDPIQDFMSLQEELSHFDSSLLRKPALIIANKIDNYQNDKKKKLGMEEKLLELQSITTLPIFTASCLLGTGLSPIVTTLGRMVRERQEEEREERRIAILEQYARQEEIQREEQQELEMVQERQRKLLASQELERVKMEEQEQEDDVDDHDDDESLDAADDQDENEPEEPPSRKMRQRAAKEKFTEPATTKKSRARATTATSKKSRA